MDVVDPAPASSAVFMALDGERLKILGLELAGVETKRKGNKNTKTRRFAQSSLWCRISCYC
jgi:hypothetical protein